MIHILEISGLVIVSAALLNAATMLVFESLRRSRAAAGDALRLRVFEEQAQVQLEAARQERERTISSWQGVRKFVVSRKVEEARDIYSFYLKPHDQQPLSPFLPGQYLTFRLRIPGDNQPVVRCYSLSDSPVNLDHYRITIKHLKERSGVPAGRASSHLATRVSEGDILDVMAPSGHFTLDPHDDRAVVLIAGGVGLTPLLSMLLTIANSGSQRETYFFYGVRRRDEHAMADTLDEIATRHTNIHITTCYSENDNNDGADHHGFIDGDLLRSILPSNNFDFFICGPPPMMDIVTSALRDWGVPDNRVHFEAFGPASAKSAVPAVAGEEHEVVFARSDTQCQWTATHQSLLELAEANAVALDSGCRAGSCGSCLTAIREGEVEYSIEPGIPVREGCCLTCIAQPKTRIVLDA